MPKRSGIEGGSRAKNLEQPPRFTARLQEITSRPLTAGNIGTYFDDALSELTQLIDQVVEEYKKTHSDDDARGAVLEDRAFEYFSLQSIQDALTAISIGKRNVGEVVKRMEDIEISDGVLVPPVQEHSGLGNGNGTFEFAKISERVRLLLYILKNEGVPIEDVQAVSIRQGTISDKMLRQTSYTRVEIPSLSRVALVCDEEGNATYIFDSEKTSQILETGKDVSLLSKEQLNELLKQDPEAGARIVYSPKWSERLRELLTAPITSPEKKQSVEVDPMLPRASKSELDSWRGFWTDPETGKHYGGIDKISKKLDELVPREMPWRSTIRTKLEYLGDSLETKKVVLLTGLPQDVFSYEDVRGLISDKEITNTSDLVREREGEWKGFYTLSNQNLHFGTLNILKGRQGIYKDSEVLRAHIDKNKDRIRTREITIGTTEQVIYCFEDIFEVLKARMTVPHVEKTGEWRGFYLHTDGKHYGTAHSLGERLGVHPQTLKDRITNIESIQSLKVVGIIGREEDAYPLEDVEAFIADFNTIPQVELEGEWKGFFLSSEDGKHYGALLEIAKRIVKTLDEQGIRATQAAMETQMVKMARSPEAKEFTKRTYRDSLGRKSSGFSFEDYWKMYSDKYLSSPRVELTGEWEDFYLNPDDGRYYGSTYAVARRITEMMMERGKTIEEPAIRERIKRNVNLKSLPHLTLRNARNVEVKGYAYEDITRPYFEKFPLQEAGNVEEGSLEIAPEGWYLNRTLAKELGTSQQTTAATADEFREIHPEWFKVYRSRGYFPQDREHYHPDLVGKIKETINSRPDAPPEGWVNRGQLRDEFGIQYPIIDRIIAPYRESHPEWFGMYLSKMSKTIEHFHPDLVAKIREASGK